LSAWLFLVFGILFHWIESVPGNFLDLRQRLIVLLLKYPYGLGGIRTIEAFLFANIKAKLAEFILQERDILITHIWFEITALEFHSIRLRMMGFLAE